MFNIEFIINLLRLLCNNLRIWSILVIERNEFRVNNIHQY